MKWLEKRERFYLSCNYYCTLYFLVKLKELNFSRLESKLWHGKTETKNEKVAKMVEFIKTCDQYPRKFNFGHLFSSIILPPFSGEMGKFLLLGVVMITTWKEFYLGA